MAYKLSLLKKILAALVIGTVFFLLGRRLHQGFGALRLEEWSIVPWKLALSLGLLVCSLALSAFVWKKILRLFGVELDFGKCFKITFVSSIGKYLPGKVWAYVSQVYLGQKAGVPVNVCLVSSAVLFLAYNLSGLFLFAVSLFFWNSVPLPLVAVLMAASMGFLLLLFSRRFLALIMRVAGRLSRRFKGGGSNGPVPLIAGPASVAGVLAVLALDWAVLTAGVYFLVNSFYPVSLSDALVVCGTLVVSVISGVLAFFVPAGLGVREGVGSYLLGSYMAPSAAILIVLAMRLWLTVGELACFVAALKIREPRLL